jgi:succinoglycan biosynthesis transport protein ExoP
VLKRLGLLRPDESNDALDERVLGFKSRVETFAVGGGLVAINFTARTPLEAKQGLQALVEEFVEEMLRPQKQSVEGSTTFLAGQLTRLREELATLEDGLTVYKADNADELPDVYKVNLDTWLSLRRQLTEVDVRMQGAIRRRELLEERLRLYDPVVQALEQRLITLQARQRELRATYREDAPQVVEATRLLAALEEDLRAAAQRRGPSDIAQLERQARGVVELDADGATNHAGDLMTGELFAWKQARDAVAAASAEKAIIEERVVAADKAVRSFARNETTLNRLNRDFETKATVYRNLLEKYEDALITRELSLFNESAQVWIVDPPNLPRVPLNPPVGVVAAGAVVGGQVVMFLVALLLDLLAGTITSGADASRRLKAPLLCEAPWLSPGDRP